MKKIFVIIVLLLASGCGKSNSNINISTNSNLSSIDNVNEKLNATKTNKSDDKDIENIDISKLNKYDIVKYGKYEQDNDFYNSGYLMFHMYIQKCM